MMIQELVSFIIPNSVSCFSENYIFDTVISTDFLVIFIIGNAKVGIKYSNIAHNDNISLPSNCENVNTCMKHFVIL